MTVDNRVGFDGTGDEEDGNAGSGSDFEKRASETDLKRVCFWMLVVVTMANSKTTSKCFGLLTYTAWQNSLAGGRYLK